MITELKSNEIFVFGSNLAGRHGRGAALTAFQKFGAVQGTGEGLEGQSYAFPTLDETLRKLDEGSLMTSIENLIACAEEHPELTFILTRVGCGLAGFPEVYIKSLFKQFTLPSNIVPYENWL